LEDISKINGNVDILGDKEYNYQVLYGRNIQQLPIPEFGAKGYSNEVWVSNDLYDIIM